MKRIISFIMCVVMLVSVTAFLTACEEDSAQPTTTTTTENETTTTTENETTTTTENETTTTGTNTTTATKTPTATEKLTTLTTTTTQTGNKTTTKNTTPVSNSPFDNNKCLILQVRGVRNGVLTGIILQNTCTAAGKTNKTVGEDIRIEFTSGAKLYQEDGITPIGSITDGCFEYGDIVMVTLGSQNVEIYSSVTGDFISCYNSDALRAITSWGERLNLMIRYKEGNPNIKTTYHKTELEEGFYKEIKGYACDGDAVYALLSPGRLIEINSKTGQIVKDAPLSPEPHEMRVYGDEIWVSLGSERVIGVFDKATFVLKRVINTPKPVFSFDVLGDYLFYSESYSHSYVYRYNMTTSVNEQFNTNLRFYKAEILVNAAAELVYVATTGSTDSMIIAFDTETITSLSSQSRLGNSVSNIVLYKDMLYWAVSRFNPTKLSSNKQYIEYNDSFQGVFSVSGDYIGATNGIYDRSSLEWLISLPSSAKSFTMITKSGNIVILRGNTLHVVTK